MGKRAHRWLAVAALLSVLAFTWMISRAQGGELRFGEPVMGVLIAGGTDTWLFVARAGDTIALSAERTDDTLEPALLIRDSMDRPVAGTRAAPGQGLALLLQVRLPGDGSYIVEISAGEGSAGAYRLLLTLLESAPLAPTPAPTIAQESDAGPITFGQPQEGEITDEVYRQNWTFSGTSGAVVDIRMTALSGDLDPFLSLIAPGGDVLVTNDAAAGGQDAGILAFQLPFTGQYTIVARRFGDIAGRQGTTTGRYTLTVNLRPPGSAATALTFGVPLRGRLTDAFPVAIYRLEFGGMVAARLDLANADRIARVRFLTATGQVLAESQGLSPLLVPARLGDRTSVLVEVSASSADGASAFDFSLVVYRFSAGVVGAAPLEWYAPRRSTAQGVETWCFTGEAGDMLSLHVTPDGPADDASVRVRAPGDVLLYQGALEPDIRQHLTLPATGLYEIEVRPPPDAAVPYRIHIEPTGAMGIPFDHYRTAPDRGALTLQQAVTATLSPGSVEARWLDARAGQVISIAVRATRERDVIGVGLLRPDGTFARVQVSSANRPALIQRALVDQTGRYRVIVFAPGGPGLDPAAPADAINYTLLVSEVSGGQIRMGGTAKGLVASGSGMAVWSLEASAGTLINLRLNNPTPVVWTPSISILAPGGGLIAAHPGASGSLDATLLGVEAPLSGMYTIVIAGRVLSGQFGAYRLSAETQMPFQADTPEIVRVSATRPPVIRYAPPTPEGPVQIHIASLINPPTTPGQVSGATTRVLAFNTTARGEIPMGEFGQVWRFTAGVGVIVQLRATALSRSAGPDLTVWDSTGALVHEQYHSGGPLTQLTFQTVRGGTYDLVVSMGLEGGRYMLSLEAPDVTVDDLRLATGAPLVYGQTASGEILTGEAAETFYFLGAAGDPVTLQLLRTGGDFAPRLQLIAPNGSTVAQAPNTARLAAVRLDDVRLPADGVYTVRVFSALDAEQPGSGGRYSLYLGLSGATRLRNRGGGTVAPGETVTGLLAPGDNEDTWLFQGRRGQRVSFTVVGQSDVIPIALRLQDTAGQTFAVQSTTFAGDPVALHDILLPGDGLYRVQVIGGRQTAGMYTLTWEPETPGAESGPLGYGWTVNGVFTPESPFDTWVFAGTAGDVVSVALRYVRGDRFGGSFQLRAADGLPLATVADVGDGRGARADVLLPFSGSYSIVVANPDPAFQGAGVYALSLNLRESRARSAGGVLRYGQQGAGSIVVDDAEDSWVFSARTGDRVRVTAQARDRFLSPVVELRSAVGELLASAQADSQGEAFIGGTPETDIVISVNGVYVITVRGAVRTGTLTTGGYLIGLTYTPAPLAEIERLSYGGSQPGLIADDRPAEFYMFSGQQGDLITATVRREAGAPLAPVIALLTDDGSLIAQADAGGGESATLRDFRLPHTGNYQLVATRNLGRGGKSAGRYTITLEGAEALRPVRGTLTYGQQALGRLTDETPVERFRFSGQAGDVVRIATRAVSGNLDTVLALETATGEVLASNDDADGVNAVISAALLPEDGQYTIVLSRVGNGSVGNYQMTVTRLYQVNASAVASGARLVYGARLVGTLDAAMPEVRYTFDGNQGDEIAVQLIHQGDDAPPLVTLRDPAGTTLAEGRRDAGRTSIERFALPVSGAYVIVVRQPANVQRPYNPFAISLDLLSARVQAASAGGVLTTTDAVSGSFALGEAAHYWLFPGTAGTSLSVELLPLTPDLQPMAILIGPDGRAVVMLQAAHPATVARAARVVLAATGLYSVLVLPGTGDQAGQYRLTLRHDPVPATIPYLEPGLVASGALDPLTPEQRWAFAGARGQMVSARMLAASGASTPHLWLISAEGQVLAEGALSRAPLGTSSVIAGFPLPESGTYYLVAGQEGGLTTGAGTYRLLMELDSSAAVPTIQAVSARRVAYGQAVRAVVQGGDTAVWAFIGTAGETISLSAVTRDSAPAGRAVALELQDTGGRVLSRAGAETGRPVENGIETAIERLTLPADGRYIVAIRSATTTGYTLIIQQRESLLPSDIASFPVRRLVRNSAQQNGISADSVVNYWSFSARAGEVIQIEGTRIDGNLRIDLALYGPSGYVSSATAAPGAAGAQLGPILLPDSGDYLLVVSRWLGASGRSVGSYRLVMTAPEGVSGSAGGAISGYGRPVTGGITSADESDTWTFAGAAGELVELRMSRLSGDLIPLVSLFGPGTGAPQGTEGMLAIGQDAEGTATVRALLPLDGQYRVMAGRVGNTTGIYRLTVARIQTAEQASVSRAEGIAFGEVAVALLDEVTPRRAWVFWGSGGERITAYAAPAPGSPLDPYLTLIGPDGSVLATDDNGGGRSEARLAAIRLPTDGFYGLMVRGSPLQTGAERFGAFTLTLERTQPGAAHQGQIAVSDEVTGRLSPDQPIQEWTFAIPPGPLSPTIAARVTSESPTFAGQLMLVTSDGEVLATAPAVGVGELETQLPGPGRFAVLVMAETGAAGGTYRLELSYALSMGGGGILVPGQAATGLITGADFTDSWRFRLTEEAEIRARAARLSGDLDLALSLHAADGTLLDSQSAEGQPGAAIAPVVLAPGQYTLLVSRSGGPAGQTEGSYTILLSTGD